MTAVRDMLDGTLNRERFAMPIPDYQSLMQPVLKLASGGEIHVRDAVDRLAADLALTPAERTTMLPSGRQTLLSNWMHWAKAQQTSR